MRTTRLILTLIFTGVLFGVGFLPQLEIALKAGKVNPEDTGLFVLSVLTAAVFFWALVTLIRQWRNTQLTNKRNTFVPSTPGWNRLRLDD